MAAINGNDFMNFINSLQQTEEVQKKKKSKKIKEVVDEDTEVEKVEEDTAEDTEDDEEDDDEDDDDYCDRNSGLSEETLVNIMNHFFIDEEGNNIATSLSNISSELHKINKYLKTKN